MSCARSFLPPSPPKRNSLTNILAVHHALLNGSRLKLAICWRILGSVPVGYLNGRPVLAGREESWQQLLRPGGALRRRLFEVVLHRHWRDRADSHSVQVNFSSRWTTVVYHHHTSLFVSVCVSDHCCTLCLMETTIDHDRCSIRICHCLWAILQEMHAWGKIESF